MNTGENFLLPQNPVGFRVWNRRPACFPNKQAGRLYHFGQIQQDFAVIENFVKGLLKRGRYSFTLQEAGEGLGKRGATLNLALQRLLHKLCFPRPFGG